MNTSLPAYLHQLLQEQAAESGSGEDAETRQLMERLSTLSESVAKAKSTILQRRLNKQASS